jgi:hypothetical protein
VKILGIAAVALALPALAAGAVSRGGLTGLVLLDPGYPVCQVGKPCTKPAPNVELVFSRRGRTVARTRTRASGSYRVRLAPGTYSVTSPARVRGGPLRPGRVAVARGRFRRVVFRLDVGLR